MGLAVLEVVSLSWEIVGYCSSFWREKVSYSCINWECRFSCKLRADHVRAVCIILNPKILSSTTKKIIKGAFIIESPLNL